jgi:hypothetical protein
MTEPKLLVAEHFEGQIWRMEVDHISHTLFAEIRNTEDRKVSFASISLMSGKTNFKNYTVDETWLTGIETAYKEVLLLHYYQAASSPTHKGLAAINAVTGQLLWHNFNYSFDQLTVNGPVVFDSRMQPPQYKLADIITGVLLRSYNPVIDITPDNHIVVPQSMPQPAKLPALPVEPYHNNVHYIEYNNYRIVSLHALWAGQMRQYLYIFNNDELIFEDILNTNIQKLQPEAFVL